MPVRVRYSPEFDQELDRLEGKYPGAADQVLDLVRQLRQGERPGDKIPRIGHDVYKVRLKNPAAQRGKSGGFRAIYYVQVANQIFLVALYSKTEQQDIAPEKLRNLIENLPKD
jgi:mRNA-degrading endonuclease RelE of RelBE toxin-antitoxin system